MTMRAWVIKQYGKPEDLVLDRIPVPSLREGGAEPVDTLVKIEGVGLNFADEIAIAGRYQDRIEPPFVPGNEFAGTVVQTSASSRFQIGDRVACQVRSGAFAEYCAVPSHRLMAIGDLPAPIAAALPVSYTTAHVALFQKANLTAGQTILIHAAAGGLGIAATQLARSAGARIIATAGSEDKRRIARENGAEHVIDYRQPDWHDEVKALAPQGVDIILDPVGGQTSERSLRLLGWRGQLLVCGFASGEIPALKANYMLVKSASVHGVYWSFDRNPEEIATIQQDLVARCADGKISPLIQQVRPISELIEAIKDLGTRNTVGKVVLAW
ncbi:NADPH:quinone oxidoreductase family protein [Sphingobium xenophagum]|uniref:NADPH:quinone oxidoreductase family protein n=1 Tax=Sphingobium xenophagum TaxID=121428 RepID=UPI00241D3D32|nr:NADPH:quinone oxidoreductase family protein [Sphingobium xenophagum]